MVYILFSCFLQIEKYCFIDFGFISHDADMFLPQIINIYRLGFDSICSTCNLDRVFTTNHNFLIPISLA